MSTNCDTDSSQTNRKRMSSDCYLCATKKGKFVIEDTGDSLGDNFGVSSYLQAPDSTEKTSEDKYFVDHNLKSIERNLKSIYISRSLDLVNKNSNLKNTSTEVFQKSSLFIQVEKEAEKSTIEATSSLSTSAFISKSKENKSIIINYKKEFPI